MSNIDNTKDELLQELQELRKENEYLKMQLSKSNLSHSESDNLKLIHELEVQQIELEMINEELIYTRALAQNTSDKYSEMNDFAPSGYFALTKTGKIIEVNLKGANLLGKERFLLINNMFAFYVSPASKSIFNNFLDKLFESKVNETCNIELSSNGNSPLYVHLSGLSTENGEQCLITVIDITENRINEKALLESYEFNNYLLKTIPFGMDIVDENGNILFMSDNFKQNFNEEIIGKKCWELFRDDKKQCFDCPLHSGINVGETKTYIAQGVLGGRTFEIYHTGMIYHDQKAMLEIFIDITERKDIEKKLLLNDFYLKKAQEIGKIGHFSYDPESNVFEGSSVLYRILDVERNTPLLNAISESVHPDDRHLILPLIERVVNEKIPYETEYRILRKDGKIIFVHSKGETILSSVGIRMIATVQDITERRNAEEALKDSENLIRDVASSFPGAVYRFVLNTDGTYKIPFMSEGAEKLFDRPINEIKDSTHLFDNLYPEDASGMWSSIAESAKSMRQWQYEFRIILKNGNFKWISGVSNPRLLPDRSICWNGVMLDITEQKTAVEELIKQKYFFEQLFMQSSVSTQILDMDGWCERINPKLSEIFGVEPHNIEGKIYNIFKDEGIIQGGIIPYLEKVFKNGQTAEWEVLFDIGIAADSQNINVKDKKKVWYENWAFPIYDINGKISHVIIQHNDIDLRKRAEEQIKHEKLFSDNLIESLPGIFYMFDSNFKPLRWNRNKAELLGLTNEQMKTHNTIDFIADKDKEKVVETFKNVFIDGEAQADVHIIRYDGRELAYHLTGIRLDTTNGPLLLGVGIDISERVKAEEELKIALVRAEESDRLKSAFLQNMSHEIRTPLNGILGFTQLLQAEDITKTEIQEYTGILQQSGKRLNEIVNNVLDIAKIETGQIAIHKKKISLNSQITNLYRFFSSIAKTKGLQLYYHNALEDQNCIINTDDSKLNQIFSNLISNAIKFTSTGKIDFGYKIKTKHSEGLKPSECNVNDDLLLFYVKDTGIGIEKKLHNRIFERFIQVEDSISRHYEGAGLGLAICKGLVELLGGKIWVESEINYGATFYFTIPYSSQINLEMKEYKSLSHTKTAKKPTILIAEDDDTSSLFLYKYFNNNKYNVLLASDGQKAIEIVKNIPNIDLILMDIRMPVINGIEATKQIKKIRPDLPIIAQTAYAFSKERERILSIGCDEYISKPIEMNQLMLLIEKYIG